jgi:hypothetical protein
MITTPQPREQNVPCHFLSAAVGRAASLTEFFAAMARLRML